ncbi:hypothetical protein IFT59_18825 [Rhizobium sp. CFBP 8752]|uniref:hypothetical protein n=1 Tax=Rhizobium sp. CFBP 8752 TaxID=2775301 RepID=UPI00177E6536|nr:hypothetical protein [Rhizobium sp. CFBP 8752]MBD8665298.1 hypothetical protein [Rhizobium sp. CFBP 8752]
MNQQLRSLFQRGRQIVANRIIDLAQQEADKGGNDVTIEFDDRRPQIVVNPQSAHALALCSALVNHISNHDAAFTGAVGDTTVSDVSPPSRQTNSKF